MEPLTVALARARCGRRRPQPRLLPRSGAARARAAADLRAHLAARRARLAAARGRAATSPRGAGNQPVLVRPRRGRRAARLPQRLPPPRLAAAQRRGHSARRRSAAATTAGPTGSTATLIGVPEGLAFGDDLDKTHARPAAGSRRGDVRPGVRQPRPRREPLADLVGDLPRRLERYRIPTLEPFAPADGEPAGQLEGGRRQLPRGLPHPDRPSRADADARLQALRRRGPRALRLVRGAAARRAERATGSSGCTARLVQPMPGLERGGPARLALRLHLPEHDDRPLPRPGRHLADRARRPWTGPATSSAPTGRRTAGRAAASCSASTSGSTPGARRGHRPRRQRAARASRRAATSAGRCRARGRALAWFADRVRADLAAEL